MTNPFTVRGVPSSIRQDGWWLACNAPADMGRNTAALPPGPPGHCRLSRNGPVGLITLIILGDLLFWNYDPGLSLALFAAAVFVAATQMQTPKRSPIQPAILLLLATLPVVEYLQVLSVAILCAGVFASVALLRVEKTAEIPVIWAAIRDQTKWLPQAGVRMLATRAAQIKTPPRPIDQSARFVCWRKHLRNWAFPIGGTAVLCALLIGANPVLERSLLSVFRFDLDLADLIRRALLWFGLAMMVTPFLIPPNLQARRDTTAKKSVPRLGLNPGSVLRALILFNLVLGVQTIIDMSILVGGAKLPAGMSLATYAHRGAYPLLVTAMLAGGFALAARPYLAEHRALKPLVLLWLGQNMLLGLTSALRLDFYVDAFGLTYLRLHAFIWMVLVVVGLALTGWQILRTRPNSWLLIRATILGVGTLYLCSFINFAGVIATANLNNKRTVDWHYLCSLGPTATKAISENVQIYPRLPWPDSLDTCWALPATKPNWREWGFRNWRMRGYGPETYFNKATDDENTAG